MGVSYWNHVLADGLRVPQDRSLHDLTEELTRMLGSTDPELREQTATATLSTWVARGVYDELLSGLGDGMATGLAMGLGEPNAESVFRRVGSARVLGECIQRDNIEGLVPALKIMEWGDRIAAWYLREADLRACIPGQGWAHAMAHGADAIGRLAESSHVGDSELSVLLDVLADRVLLPAREVLTHGEIDRIAAAVLTILRRDLVPLSELEPWVARLTEGATRTDGSGQPDADGYEDPYLVTGNADALLRALHLQLSLGTPAPAVRSDLLLVLIDALKTANPELLRPPGPHQV